MGRRDPRYERDYWRYAAPFAGWYPGGFWGGASMYGWGGLGGEFAWPPYPVPVRYGAYDYEHRPPRRPEQSPTYGRGGDEAARRWAQRYGYDVEYTIRPRARNRGGYDRGFRGGG